MSTDRIPDVRYPGGWNVGRTSADVRHPDKVERWPNRIPDVRHPGGMRENFRPGGMSDATCCKGPSACPREREPRGIFREDPTVGGCASSSGRLHNHQGKNCRVSLLKGLLQP